MVARVLDNLALAGVAALAAVTVGTLLVTSLAAFGPLPGILTALALPAIVAALAIGDKKRKLFFFMVLTLPIVVIDLPPRQLGISVFDVMLTTLVVLVGLEFLLDVNARWRWQKTIFTSPLLALLAMALISGAFGRDPWLATLEILGNVKYLLFYLLCLHIVRTPRDLRLVCMLLLWGSVPCVLLGLAQYFLGLGLDLNPDTNVANTSFRTTGIDLVRVFGPFDESLTFAQYLMVPLSLLAGLLLHLRRPASGIAIGALFAVGSLTLLLTFSRGSWAAFLLTLAVVVGLRVPRGLLTYLAAWPVALAVAAIGYWNVIVTIAPASIAARIDSLGTDFFVGRGYLWSAAFDMVLDHPFLGVGLRSLYYVLPDYAPAILYDPFYITTLGLSPLQAALIGHVHVDNFYLTLLAEIGVLGMLPLVVLFYRAIAQARRNYRSASLELKPYALGIFGALLATIVSMSTIYGYSEYRLALLLWMLLAMTVVLQRFDDRHAGA